MESISKDCQDPWKFNLFLGDVPCKSSPEWPGNATFQSVLQACEENVKAFMATVTHKVKERRFFVTDRGDMGLGPQQVKDGGFICVCPGV